MPFTYKNEAELAAMTPEQRDSYATEKRAHEAATLKSQIEEATKNNASKAEIEELRETLKQIQESASAQTAKSESVEKQLADNKELLKAIASGTSAKEVVVKALTNRASVQLTQQAYDLPDIGQLATRKLSMYDVFPKLNLSGSNDNGTIRYYDWDEDTIVRAAASVAEGALFPESTAKFKRYSLPIQKIGDTLPVTEEFFEDENMFAAELGMFLEVNVNLAIDTQLADGDGTSNTLVGLKASVPAYVAPEAGIQDASIYDLIVKVREAITATGGSKYSPDVVFMNITDINKMKLKKDDLNNYIMPPFATVGGQVVDGITVIESNNITANTLVLGDRRYARIYERGGLVLSKGLVGTQFTEDEMTLKARKRLAFLIRNADKGGWRKVTDIAADLVTLATVPA
jgi:HK97 family phage major capsid protein